MSYKVKTNIFEGPFDLLVYLIEHAQMSIYDIRISEITKQYIDYVEDMKNADIAVSSEFIVLAAALLEIKSRMLLPRSSDESESGYTLEDPRSELVQRLVEYKRFKAVSDMLRMQEERTCLRLEKPQEDLTEYTGEPDEYLDLDIDKFRTAFEQFLLKKRRLDEIRRHHVRTEKQRITTEARIDDIRLFFSHDMKEADFKELVHDESDKYDIAVTFSAVLEMMKERTLDAEQKYVYGDIMVRPTEHLLSEEVDAGAHS